MKKLIVQILLKISFVLGLISFFVFELLKNFSFSFDVSIQELILKTSLLVFNVSFIVFLTSAFWNRKILSKKTGEFFEVVNSRESYGEQKK